MDRVKAKDFSHQERFPGTKGNPFDIFLHRMVALEKVPVWAFFITVLLPIFLIKMPRWNEAVIFSLFILADYLLLVTLPISHKSYGPVKFPVILLAVLRALFLFLSPAWWIPIQLIGTILVIYAFWIEPHHIHLTRAHLTSRKLSNRHPIRIMHIGDLHVERVTEREKDLNRLIQREKPDLILFSGDLLNLSYLRDPVSHQALREVISAWQAPNGVYGVAGSPAVDLPELFPELIDGLPICWLEKDRLNLSIRDQPIDLFGLTCTHQPHRDFQALNDLVDNLSCFSILLYHSPDLAPQVANLNIDLQLSGHTHGGQVRLPFIGALFTGSLYGRKFQAGRYRLGHLTLYISRGLGMEGMAAPRVRFLTPPEVIVWELTGMSVEG